MKRKIYILIPILILSIFVTQKTYASVKVYEQGETYDYASLTATPHEGLQINEYTGGTHPTTTKWVDRVDVSISLYSATSDPLNVYASVKYGEVFIATSTTTTIPATTSTCTLGLNDCQVDIESFSFPSGFYLNGNVAYDLFIISPTVRADGALMGESYEAWYTSSSAPYGEYIDITSPTEDQNTTSPLTILVDVSNINPELNYEVKIDMSTHGNPTSTYNYTLPQQKKTIINKDSAWVYFTINQNLFIPQHSNPTQWTMIASLWSCDGTTCTTTDSYDTRDFTISNTYTSSTDITYLNRFIHGRMVNLDNQYINSSGQFVDLRGNVTTTPVTADTNDDTEESLDSMFYVDCSAYTGLWSNLTGAGTICHLKKVAYGIAGYAILPSPYKQDGSIAYFKSALDGIKKVFPFSIIYQTSDLVQDTVTNLITTTTPTLTIPIKGTNFTILTSSTLEQVAGSEIKDKIFEFLEMFIWLGTGAIILFTMI